MTKTPTGFNYVRHRLYPRIRHRKPIANFLAAEVTALAASATGQTVAPVRTTNTKAEAPLHFGGNLSDADTVTIGNFTYTFKTALAEVKASGTLTNDGSNVTAADTVTIDGHVYTFKASLTEVKAAGTLTNDGSNVTDGDTVTIGAKVYTFQGTLTNVDGHVHIGASNTASMTNLFHAINAAGGTAGTDYAAATTANTQVVATNPSGTTVVATAITAGVAANAIATTEASTHLSWGAATLAGGVDPIANEVHVGASNTASMTNLFEAINAGANGGTDYASNTVAHTTVVATNPSGTTVVATEKVAGTAGNAIATTEVSTHLSWGAATLTGGVESIANQVLIDDTAAHTRDNLMNAITRDGGAGTNAGVKYSSATVVHDKVTASANSGDMTITALLDARQTPGMSVALAKSAVNLTLPTLHQLDGPAWTATTHPYTDGEGPVLLTSATTLPAGTPTTELFVHVIDSSTVAFATSREALRKGNFIQTTDDGTGTHTATRDVTAAGMFGLLTKNKPRTVAAASDVDSLN